MAALIQTVAERGLAGTTVRRVCHRSGISTRAYRSEFSTIEDCLVATFESQVRMASARMVSSYRAPAGEDLEEVDRLAVALGALMHLVVTGPAAAKLCMVEVRGAGPAAIASHERAMWQLADLLAGARPGIRGDLELARALAGGVWQVIHRRLVGDRTEELPGLVADLSLWIAQYTDPCPPLSGATAGRQPETVAGDATEGDEQRDRLLHATATLVRSGGYGALTTHAIANRAGCSPSTFYRYFSSKTEAALAIYDNWVTDKWPDDRTSGEDGNSDFAGIRALVASLEQSLDDDPDDAYLAIVAVFALGKTGHERRLRTLLGIERLLRDSLCDDAVSSVAIEATVGALWEALYSHALNRSHARDLQVKLAFLLLTPFMGSERAGVLARSS